MKTLKISPSVLEQFRTCRLGLYNKSENDFIDYMTGDFVRSENMARGTAYHEMIEFGTDNFKNNDLYEVYERDFDKVFTFTEEQVQPINEFRSDFPNMVHEVRSSLIVNIDNKYHVRLNFVIDAIDGLLLLESKTTSSKYTPNYKTYEDSLQWRCYLLSNPDAEQIQYNVFHFKSLKSEKKETVTRYTFDYYRYANLENDVMNWIRDLINFMETRDLLGLIEDKLMLRQ